MTEDAILWQGRPEPRAPLDVSRPAQMIMGLAFIVFSMVWMQKALQADAPVWPAGLIFLGLGLKLAVWGPWQPRLRAHFAHYAITRRSARAEIRWPLLGTRRQEITITPATIIDIDGADPASLTLTQMRATPRGTRPETLRLDRIAEARRVLALLRDIQKAAA